MCALELSPHARGELHTFPLNLTIKDSQPESKRKKGKYLKTETFIVKFLKHPHTHN